MESITQAMPVKVSSCNSFVVYGIGPTNAYTLKSESVKLYRRQNKFHRCYCCEMLLVLSHIETAKLPSLLTLSNLLDKQFKKSKIILMESFLF